MFPKIVGFSPQIIYLKIGFSIINHPFWGIPNFWKHPYHQQCYPSWWSQPIWKICASQIGSFPPGRGENLKKKMKPPPSICSDLLYIPSRDKITYPTKPESRRKIIHSQVPLGGDMWSFPTGYIMCMYVYTRKQTWNLEIPPWKRRNIYKPSIFGFHVCFGVCVLPHPVLTHQDWYILSPRIPTKKP